eukprot:6061754-Pyramimonas_sp.AAC.1
MIGAMPGRSIAEVSWPLQLAIDVRKVLGQILRGVSFDRRRCFDLLVFVITYGLQKSAGCPVNLLNARESFYGACVGHYKLMGCYSSGFTRANGRFQGCVFSIDDCLLLMRVW